MHDITAQQLDTFIAENDLTLSGSRAIIVYHVQNRTALFFVQTNRPKRPYRLGNFIAKRSRKITVRSDDILATYENNELHLGDIYDVFCVE